MKSRTRKPASDQPRGQPQGARVTRPELPRTVPLRSWAGVLGSANPPSEPGAPARGKSAASVQRGVELGYRVVDEYMKQATAVANAFGGPRPRSAPTGDDLPQMTQRMMQYASDFSALWFDAMAVMMRNAEGQGARARGADKPQAAPAPAQTRASMNVQRSRLNLELRSMRPAQIIVALDEPLLGPVRVEALSARAGAPKITDVSLEAPEDAAGPLKLRVHVPNRIAPGRYTGAVVDAETGQPRGRLTVTISK